MTNDKYFLNGEYISAQEVRDYFLSSKMEPKKARTRDKIVAEILKQKPKPKTLLDIGCFEGSFSEYLRLVVPEIQTTAVDYFQENIKIAKFLYPHLSSSFHCNSVYDLKFPDQSFDFVTFKEVIEHLDRPVDAIREINRILINGGCLFVSTPNATARPDLGVVNSLRRHVNAFAGKSEKIKPAIFHEGVEFSRHIYSWTSKTLYTLLKINGFELVKHGFIGGGLIPFLLPEFSNELFMLVKKVKDSPKEIV